MAVFKFNRKKPNALILCLFLLYACNQTDVQALRSNAAIAKSGLKPSVSGIHVDLGKQTLDIYRTFVPNVLRGRGVAAALTEQALEYAERSGYSVIPSCSYVERYIERHQRQQAKS